MNLIWVPNQQIALYFLAFCSQNKDFGKFNIFVQDESVIPEMQELAAEMEINFVDRIFATNNSFQNFIMFSFGILSYQEEVRRSVTYNKLWLFGDNFNNSFYLHSHARHWEIEGLVYFGYDLIDEALISAGSLVGKKKRIIGVNEIANIVKELQHRRKIVSYNDTIDSKSFLILDRYWGSDSYPISDWTAYQKYIKEIVNVVDDSFDIVYKGVESSFASLNDKKRNEIVKSTAGSRFRNWNEIVQSDVDFLYLTSPEALILGNRITPSSIFAFDGSTSLVSQLVEREIKVIWPDVANISGIFHEDWIENLIKEKVEIYKQVISSTNGGKDTRQALASTAGINMREFMNRFITKHYVSRLHALIQERDELTQHRSALIQERDELTQHRSALIQERDELTQHRSALIQERDELTNSTIWRATKGVRVVVKWIKRKD